MNGVLGLLVGLVAFGLASPRFILAAAIYVSSSAITVKGLIDFRRLADDETDLVLAILVFEDIVIAVVLGVASQRRRGGLDGTPGRSSRPLPSSGVALAIPSTSRRPIDLLLARLPLRSSSWPCSLPRRDPALAQGLGSPRRSAR